MGEKERHWNWMRLGLFAAIGLAAVLYAFAAYLISQVRHEQIALDQDERLIVVSPGQSFAELASMLEAEGMIRDAWWFSALAEVEGVARSIQAGEYRIRRGEELGELLERLRLGDVANYKLRLIEGKRIADAIELMRQTPGIVFDEPVPHVEVLGEWLGLPWRHGEGGILPDTYLFRSGEDGRAILLRAANALKIALAAAWDSRDENLPLDSPYELLILASLIEKESGTAADSFRISRVFANRLNLDMRLQADPSVIYGMGDAFTGDLLRSHLREDTPYNTYTREGLSPSPIALVSVHSLRAAAQPEEGPWKYFVARGDGSSEFSVTLREHDRAVRAYITRR